MLHWMFEEAFSELLACWREHERRTAHPLVEIAWLAESRIALDEARGRVNTFRRAVHPTDDEQADGVESVFCSTIDAVVHLSWRNRDPNDDRLHHCPCGHQVQLSPLGEFTRAGRQRAQVVRIEAA